MNKHNERVAKFVLKYEKLGNIKKRNEWLSKIIDMGDGLPLTFILKYRDMFNFVRMEPTGELVDDTPAWLLEPYVPPPPPPPPTVHIEPVPIEPTVHIEPPPPPPSPVKKAGRKRQSKVKNKGVTWDGRRWVARFEGKYLGKFRDPRDAAEAYRQAAEEKYGVGGAEL